MKPFKTGGLVQLILKWCFLSSSRSVDLNVGGHRLGLSRWIRDGSQASEVGRGGVDYEKSGHQINVHLVYVYIPGTQMTLILIGKGLLLEGSSPKIEDKQVPGIHCVEVWWAHQWVAALLCGYTSVLYKKWWGGARTLKHQLTLND